MSAMATAAAADAKKHGPGGTAGAAWQEAEDAGEAAAAAALQSADRDGSGGDDPWAGDLLDGGEDSDAGSEPEERGGSGAAEAEPLPQPPQAGPSAAAATTRAAPSAAQPRAAARSAEDFSSRLREQLTREGLLGALVAAAYPDRIAERKERSNARAAYTLATGARTAPALARHLPSRPDTASSHARPCAPPTPAPPSQHTRISAQAPESLFCLPCPCSESGHVLPCTSMSCHVLPCPAMSCHVLPCPAMSCHVIVLHPCSACHVHATAGQVVRLPSADDPLADCEYLAVAEIGGVGPAAAWRRDGGANDTVRAAAGLSKAAVQVTAPQIAAAA
jgi:hypothetical protein